MPLIMSPCGSGDANSLAQGLAQAHFATLADSAPPPSKHYLKITDSSTNEIAAYAIWIPVPPPPPSCKLTNHDPWLLSSSQLVTANNSKNSGLCIGIRERMWSSCLYRGARVASNLRRLGLKAKGVDKECRKRMRMSVGSCVGLVAT